MLRILLSILFGVSPRRQIVNKVIGTIEETWADEKGVHARIKLHD